MKKSFLSILLIFAFMSIQSAMLFHTIEHKISSKISYNNQNNNTNNQRNKHHDRDASCPKCKLFVEISAFSTPNIININLETDKPSLKTFAFKILKIDNIFKNYLSRAPPIA